MGGTVGGRRLGVIWGEYGVAPGKATDGGRAEGSGGCSFFLYCVFSASVTRTSGDIRFSFLLVCSFSL